MDVDVEKSIRTHKHTCTLRTSCEQHTDTHTESLLNQLLYVLDGSQAESGSRSSRGKFQHTQKAKEVDSNSSGKKGAWRITGSIKDRIHYSLNSEEELDPFKYAN